MAFVTISEDEEKGQFIYPGSKFSVVTITKSGGSKVGHRTTVAHGTAEGTFGVNLDEGTYRVVVNSLASRFDDKVKWIRDITVGDYSPAELKKLEKMKAKWAKPIHTSDGARWNCTFPSCHNSATSQRGAVVHEFNDHLGLDPVRASKVDVSQAAKKATRV